MSYSRDDYYQECFEVAMSDEGLDHLLSQMTAEQRANIGGAIAGAVENEGTAFYTPENPMIERNRTLERKLKWERELITCKPCGGRGRLEYSAGAWAVNSHCDSCHGSGKVHPLGDREPA
ncbi:hypothetical protein ABIC65_001030 [Sphingomonas trueperi]|uniref:hypothetical protein n=1 Tax=Sphingomonas trueperi TaxID=53317 RepID=UPI003396C2D8